MADEKRRIVMACPVGTSLTANVNTEPLSELKELLDELRQLNNKQESIDGTATDKIQKRIESVSLKWLDSKEFKNNLKYPSAELQSVIRWICKINSVCDPIQLELHLLPSNNLLSYATAYITLYLLTKIQEHSFLGEEMHVEINTLTIEQLPVDISNEEAFNKSVDGLFKKYDELRNVANGDEMVINCTGGFKAICVFSAIYAQINNMKSIYTFEGNFSDILELPPLPIGYAIESLDDEISLLKGLQNTGILKDIGTLQLPPWLKSLIRRNGEISSLAITLLEHYEKHRYATDAIGSGMLDQLKDPASRDYIEKLIRGPWSYLWLGDQIPETVEHSRRHSKRLMEMAGNLYRVSGDKLAEIGMTKPQTVALLISAIYLHDIGHTVMAHPVSEKARKAVGGVFPLGSFPSCVREAHHLLSAELIRNMSETLFASAKQAEQQDGNQYAKIQEIQDMLIQLVPYISEHHRGYTKLTGKGDATCKKTMRSVGELLYGTTFAKTLRPLDERLEADSVICNKLESWDLSVRDIVTTAALLRVIDGCDVQSDRTINTEYVKTRLDLTKHEGEAIRWELRPLLASKWINFAGPIDRIHEISHHLDPAAVASGKLAKNEAGELKNICITIYDAVMDSLLSIKSSRGGYLLTPDIYQDMMTLSLINRYAFKWEQFLHFYKHSCVRSVLPIDNVSSIIFSVFPNLGVGNDDIQAIVDDINEEINETGQLLKDMEIKAEMIT